MIRTTLTYPASTGRNFDEILRVIVPSITDPKELAERFPKGFRAVRPYLRLTPQPNKQGGIPASPAGAAPRGPGRG